MKPAAFTYHRPATRDEVDALLEQLGDEATILAGGQSLVPIMSMRLAAPAHVIDINHLEDETTEPLTRDGVVVCGPLVRHEAAEHADLVARHVPLLAEALPFVAHPAIRSRGTVAGSIAHADPAAELPAVIVALGGEVVARSARGARTIPARGFFDGPLENALAADEWVTEVRWPTQRGGFAFEEFARRAGDYALCGVAAAATRTGTGVRIALAYLGMGDAPAKLELDDDEALDEAIDTLVDEHLDPPEDIHASSPYRVHLARRLGTRAARRALEGVSAA
jgi:aerobic carbon-monoxide dehydrogenase medium subunit